jgi:hypothetical protein
VYRDEHYNENVKERDIMDVLVQRDTNRHQEQRKELTKISKTRNARIKVMRRVRVTIVAVEKAISITYCELCVYSLSYPACKAHASYYIVICGLSGCTIFFHIIS